MHAADHSPPSNAEVKNGWSHTSTPSLCLHGAVSSYLLTYERSLQFLHTPKMSDTTSKRRTNTFFVMPDAQNTFQAKWQVDVYICLYSTSVPNLTYLTPVVQQLLSQTRKLKRNPLCRRQVILSCTKALRVRLKCDGTRAGTGFRLSAKRTSPFKSAEASVQSTAGSRGVRISGSNAGYTVF